VVLILVAIYIGSAYMSFRPMKCCPIWVASPQSCIPHASHTPLVLGLMSNSKGETGKTSLMWQIFLSSILMHMQLHCVLVASSGELL